MIYYQILSCKQTSPVYKYQYSEEDEKKFEPYLKPAYAYAMSPIYSNYTDSEGDVDFYTGLDDWLGEITVSHVTDWIYDYTKIEYPDGSELYRYNGLNVFGMPKSETPSTLDLINIYLYNHSYQRNEYWAPLKELAKGPTSISDLLPVILPVTGGIPVIA